MDLEPTGVVDDAGAAGEDALREIFAGAVGGTAVEEEDLEPIGGKCLLVEGGAQRLDEAALLVQRDEERDERSRSGVG